MTHDPLCSAIEEIGSRSHVDAGFVRNCQCQFIARARKDGHSLTFYDDVKAWRKANGAR